jgi:hypothetical protein
VWKQKLTQSQRTRDFIFSPFFELAWMYHFASISNCFFLSFYFLQMFLVTIKPLQDAFLNVEPTRCKRLQFFTFSLNQYECMNDLAVTSVSIFLSLFICNFFGQHKPSKDTHSCDHNFDVESCACTMCQWIGGFAINKFGIHNWTKLTYKVNQHTCNAFQFQENFERFNMNIKVFKT